MNTCIFATYAPIYWSVGLPVIPLIPRNKRPSISLWSTYCSQMPDEATQQHWLQTFADGNIGLPFGPASGLPGADGGMILEHLGNGNPAILNPSIHPNTQQPYVATADLWSVLDEIPEIDRDIESKLRSLLGAIGPAGSNGG